VTRDKNTIEAIMTSLFFIVRQRCVAVASHGSLNAQVADVDEYSGADGIGRVRGISKSGFLGMRPIILPLRPHLRETGSKTQIFGYEASKVS
jgi:hypothetical protein